MHRLVGSLVAVVLLAGCAVGEQHRDPAEMTASIEDAGAQAASAVATVRTVVRQLGEDRIVPTLADTAQADSIRVLEEATRTLTTLAPVDGPTRTLRDEMLNAVQEATSAVVDAGAWITGPPQNRTEVPAGLLRTLDTAWGGLSS